MYAARSANQGTLPCIYKYIVPYLLCLEQKGSLSDDMSSLPDIHAPPAQVTKPGKPNTELVEEIAALRKELKVEGDPLKPKLTVPDYPMQPSTASPK